MEFVNSLFLYGFFAVSIPILIHLFNFRRYKKEYFSNIYFLKELQVKRKRKSRLRQLIILLLRILAISSLVLAFAQPYIPLTGSQIRFEEPAAICIYVDNSMSMEAETPAGFLIDEAKAKAVDIAESYKPSDVYQILSNNFEGKHHRFVSREDLISWINEIEPTAVVRKLSDVVNRFTHQLNEIQTVNKIIYIISDFQKSVTDINNFEIDSSVNIYLIPLSSIDDRNIYIDTCWFDTPVFLTGQQVELNVRIRNNSGNEYEKIPVKLTINGTQKAIASFDIAGKSSELLNLPYTIQESGLHSGVVEINDYPVTFDDRYFISYEVKSRVPVLVINNKSENQYINYLFEEDPAIELINVLLNNLDYSSLSRYKLIILNDQVNIPSGLSQELGGFVEQGGSLVILPSIDADRDSYNALFSRLNTNQYQDLREGRNNVDYINTDHPIFRNVFRQVPENSNMPFVTKYYKIGSLSRVDQEVLLRLSGGDIFFNVTDKGSGKVYVSAVPLREEFSNLPVHAIFVPMFYNIALLSNNTELVIRIIGQDKALTLDNLYTSPDEVVKITGLDSNIEFIPEQNNINGKYQLFVHDQVQAAGNYRIVQGENPIKAISFNYNRLESILDCYNNDELNTMINKSGYQNIQLVSLDDQEVDIALQELNKGTQLWKLFVIFALVFLAGEIAVIRLWKT